MTKLKLLVPLVALVMLGGVARADRWRCEYKGDWTNTNDGNGGRFTWSLMWESRDGGWKVTGDYEDRYGSSTLDGHCRDKRCTLDQHYTSGQLDGKWYYWQGTYSDTNDGPGRTINTFTGTWGNAPNHRGSGGEWKAKAVCRKQ
jgi:hypothetical protein